MDPTYSFNIFLVQIHCNIDIAVGVRNAVLQFLYFLSTKKAAACGWSIVETLYNFFFVQMCTFLNDCIVI